MSETPPSTRILVIRAGALGDTVCATSIIEPLRIEFGEDVEIEWVAKAGMGALFAADPRIAKVHELKNRRLPLPLNRQKAALVRASRHRPYDYVINLELGPLFNDLVRAVQARHKVGMPYHYFAEPPEAHAVENLRLIYRSVLGSEAISRAWPTLKGPNKTEIRQRFNLPESWYVLVPANSHLGKRRKLNHRAWPLAHWKKLLEMIDAANIPAVLVGAPGDRHVLDSLGPLPASTRDLIGKTNITELIGIIASAQEVIATDTGPAHMAAAVGTPVTVLIGPTNARRTAPYATPENRIQIISANLPCSPCYHSPSIDNCNKNHCMIQIHPEDILNRL